MIDDLLICPHCDTKGSLLVMKREDPPLSITVDKGQEHVAGESTHYQCWECGKKFSETKQYYVGSNEGPLS